MDDVEEEEDEEEDRVDSDEERKKKKRKKRLLLIFSPVSVYLLWRLFLCLQYCTVERSLYN